VVYFWLDLSAVAVFGVLLLVATVEILCWKKVVKSNRSYVGETVIRLFALYCLVRCLGFASQMPLDLYPNSLPPKALDIIFLILANIMFYVIFVYILFSWAEAALILEAVAGAEKKARDRRTIACIVAAIWTIVGCLSALAAKQSSKFVAFSVVYSILWGILPIPLTIVTIIYWRKLYQLVKERALQKSQKFTTQLSTMALIFIVCLDAKAAYYIVSACTITQIVQLLQNLPEYYLNATAEVVASISLLIIFSPFRKSTGNCSATTSPSSTSNGESLEPV